MKKSYVNPELELISFETQDVVQTSTDIGGWESGGEFEGGFEV